MMIRGPGIRAAITLDHMTQHIDLAPTIADLVRTAPPAAAVVDGRSMAPLFFAPSDAAARQVPWREDVLFEYWGACVSDIRPDCCAACGTLCVLCTFFPLSSSTISHFFYSRVLSTWMYPSHTHAQTCQWRCRLGSIDWLIHQSGDNPQQTQVAVPGAYCHHIISSWNNTYVGVRTADDLKFVLFQDSENFTEFYNISADPYEITNLAHDPSQAAKIALLRARVEKLRACAGDTCRSGA